MVVSSILLVDGKPLPEPSIEFCWFEVMGEFGFKAENKVSAGEAALPVLLSIKL